MTGDLELPNGDVVAPGEVLLFEGYPYRYVDADGAIVLSPIYWGESALDLRFESRVELEERWGDGSRGVLSAAEWRAWIEDARERDTFADAEVDALADALLPDRDRSVLDRLRRLVPWRGG